MRFLVRQGLLWKPCYCKDFNPCYSKKLLVFATAKLTTWSLLRNQEIPLVNQHLATDEMRTLEVRKTAVGLTAMPRAPHSGGLWEAGVKSAKHLLLRTVGSLLLTAEEL
ncbi:hypothetical protein ACLKA7_000842 [Drosophila subpalustris]